MVQPDWLKSAEALAIFTARPLEAPGSKTSS
jgi:hypothetical protein